MVTTIGIDAHKAIHTAVAIDNAEKVLGELTVSADRSQTDRLVEWASRLDGDGRLWAIEAAGGLGYLLSQQLIGFGEQAVEAAWRRGFGCSDRAVRTYATRALAQHRLGEAEPAVNDATAAIELAPPDRDTLALAYVTRALAHNRLGQPTEAIGDATAAIDEAPTDRDTLTFAYVIRALGRGQAGQIEEAIDDATTAIARAPSTRNLFGVAAIRFTGTVYGPNPCNNEEVNGDTQTLILYRAPNAGRLRSEDHPVVLTILSTSQPDENLAGTYNNHYRFGLVAQHEFDTVQETYRFATEPPDLLEWIGLDGAPSYRASTSRQSVTISDGSWNHEFTTDATCNTAG